MEQNKTGKYFKYAIGEIVLVVIGILIALSINNWNEKRRDLNKEQIYLKELRTSLITDSLEIKRILKFNEGKILIVQEFLSIFNSEMNNQQRSNIINKNATGFTLYEMFNPKQTTWNNLLSSESLSIITNKNLRNLLMDYYSFNYNAGVQERIKIINRKVVDENFPEFVTYEYALQRLGFETEFPLMKELKIHLNRVLLSDLYGMTFLINMQNEFLLETSTQIKAVLQLIDKNLN